MKILEILEQKGKLATLLGFALGVVATVVMSVLLIKDQDYKYLPFVIAFGISILLFILPSSLTVEFKDFKLELKD